MILSIIILAAGQGTRMNSEIPKVFHEVGNYPMICHVLDLSQKLKAQSTTVVISKKLIENIIEDIFEVILESLMSEGKVKISNFGTFILRHKKSRIGRNPKTKKEAVNSERNVIEY